MKNYFLICSAFLCLISCTKNVNEPSLNNFTEGQKVKISLSFPEESSKEGQVSARRIGGSTTGVAGTNITYTWEENDQVIVKVGEKTATFTLVSKDGNSATFEGNMPDKGNSFTVIAGSKDENPLGQQKRPTQGGLYSNTMRFEGAGTLNQEDPIELVAKWSVLFITCTYSHTFVTQDTPAEPMTDDDVKKCTSTAGINSVRLRAYTDNSNYLEYFLKDPGAGESIAGGGQFGSSPSILCPIVVKPGTYVKFEYYFDYNTTDYFKCKYEKGTTTHWLNSTGIETSTTINVPNSGTGSFTLSANQGYVIPTRISDWMCITWIKSW